jgi:FAD synthetase
MIKVMVFGTFDGLHEGHLNLFLQAKEHGDFLIAVAGRDVNIRKVKGHLPRRRERERLTDLQKCKIVNQAVLGFEDNPYKIIENLKPNVICLGYDQNSFTKNLRKEIKKMGLKIKIYRLNPFKPGEMHSSILSKKKTKK